MAAPSPSESHQRIRQIFEQALERPEAERLLFIETACAGNPTLFEAVERLLRARGASQSFLEQDCARNTQRIGRYLIRRELGRGAMGVVYDAIDPLIGRSVAVKVIRVKDVSEPGEAEFLTDRLFREARSAGQLFHPGIVIILDVGQEGDCAFIAMERVDGPTLQQMLASGQPLSAAEALRILEQTAAALDYAHQHGIVHRDIKPANIMLHNAKTVKVADFGIAKIMSTQHTTVAGLVMGTPSYMSPEQLEARSVDGRSDQFSLAVVAYELLTRVKPFEADSIATLAHLIVYGPRRSIRVDNPALPPGVDRVFQRVLARSPEDRFATCSEFVAALRTAIENPPTALEETSVAQKPVLQPAKKGQARPLGLLVGIPALVLVLAAAFFLYRYPGWRAPFTPTKPAPFVASAASMRTLPSTKAPIPVPSALPVAAVATPSLKAASAPPPASSVPTAGSSTTTHPATTVVETKPAPAISPAERAQQLYKAGIAMRAANRLPEAATLFRRAAELGNTDAMSELGGSYRDGEGVNQDQGEALRWFRLAADAGNSWAMVNLGSMYLLGYGVDVDENEAFRWFQKAAAQNNPAGIYELGTMYEKGLGAPENPDKARQLYQKAAALGNGPAKTKLQPK